MPDHERGCIRPVSRHDLAALIELCAEHAAYEGASYDPQGKVESLTRALFAPHPRLYAWVVEQRGRLVGYATATQEFSTWDAACFLHMDCLYLRDVLSAGLGVITRSRAYHLLELPVVKQTLTRSPDDVSTHPESHMTRALYNCASVPLTPTGPEVRLVVATHPGTGSDPAVGVERDGTVYELFISTLPTASSFGFDLLATA